ncbi:Fur family transcriptional regulator [Megalodesulfovibrio gigas]|uniref:Putative Fur family ferric uptake regulator n=1 Tax=Megalodesulfovibrio gigas (strain ATCC 19364 / DSM 1382 / NCIMB 9332 / VKM B-1759) TaxID=1121448 RepID=T2G8F3_MEGG1|nr:Fur family transcriptional regulator [Megalodesulfovibrio gigas]AGW12870.1 putative Fur family ferric uptake regulator [Megalodesulfovibrio gigas DSM 1382 = ATCC 19364]
MALNGSPGPDVPVAQARLERMLARLKEEGHRLTPQRVAILRVLAESAGHPSVEQVHQRVLRQYPNTSLATVYKAVTLLKQRGEVLELGFSERDNRYDGARPEPHPHLICTACGAILDPQTHDPGVLEEMARRVAAETGYAIAAFRLDFYGLCPACQAGQQVPGMSGNRG